ncbi:hypothetical protein [Streptomyces sp. NPDC101150]|uniref:hypothetical protein n=1 Tax=Streptomyces sp. NPDC101150 TaxID=3366114 RepID=UPI003827BE93
MASYRCPSAPLSLSAISGHLGAQLHHQPVEFEVAGPAALQILEELFDTAVSGEFPVGQGVASLEVFAHG